MKTCSHHQYGALIWMMVLILGLHIDSVADDTQVNPVKASSIAEMARECVKCHRGPQSLDDVADAELTAMILAMMAGEMDHPTELPKLTEQQVAELVRALKPE